MHLGRLPRLTLRLLPRTAPLSRCFVFHTFWHRADNLPICTDKICPNRSYCVACRCSTTGDVPLDAFNSIFSLGTQISSLCGPNLHLEPLPRLTLHLLSPAANLRLQTMTVMESVTHPSIHASMHTVAHASPCVYSDLSHSMLWVAGGICKINCHYDRYRGKHSDLKLSIQLTCYIILP